MAVPQYLNGNKERIKAYNQDYDGWFEAYSVHKKIEPISQVYKVFNLDNKPLNRRAIKDLFNNYENANDLYFAFICTMVWGKRGLVGDGGVNKNFVLYETNKKQIIQTLQNSITLMKENKLNDAWKTLSGLKGLGPSYLTKLIYFFSYDFAETIKLRPLIFDTIQAKNYASLLIQAGSLDKFKKLYRGDLNNVYSKINFNMYNEYLKDMNDWATKIEVEPDNLEAFIFGIGIDASDNPRLALKTIANNYLNNNQS
jgi:hypothetical protein